MKGTDDIWLPLVLIRVIWDACCRAIPVAQVNVLHILMLDAEIALPDVLPVAIQHVHHAQMNAVPHVLVNAKMHVQDVPVA